ERVPGSAPAAQLAEAIGRAAFGTPIDTVRMWHRGGASMERFVATLDAARAAGARTIVLETGSREPDVLHARLHGSGGFGRVASLLGLYSEHIDDCYARAAFVHPDLRGSFAFRVLVQAGGVATASFPEGFDPLLAICLGDLIHSLKFPIPAGALDL